MRLREEKRDAQGHAAVRREDLARSVPVSTQEGPHGKLACPGKRVLGSHWI
jgi:hypothetical protein